MAGDSFNGEVVVRNRPRSSNSHTHNTDENQISQSDHETEVNAQSNEQGAPQAQPQQEDMWSMVKKMLYRIMMFYLISSLIRGYFQPQGPVDHHAGNQTGKPQTSRHPSRNLFTFLDRMDLFFYISESDAHFQNFNHPGALFWHLENVQYGDWSDFTKSGQLVASPNVQDNGSIYLHVFATKSGYQPDPSQESSYSEKYTFYKQHRLNKYKKKRYQKTANLLTGKSDQKAEDVKKAEIMKAEILSHWHPNLTINLVTDQTNWVPGSIPPPLDEFIDFEPTTGSYYPPLFFNEYWNLNSDYQPINNTVEVLNLTLTVSPLSLFKWQLYATQTMRSKWSQMFGSSSVMSSLFEEEDPQDDQDSLKQAMLDTNPYLLGLTVVVSILHTVFEFLAFKNDIQFWRNRKSLEGLSVKSVLFNLVTSVIVLLYVLDNETNFVVRLSVFVGVIIELWKVPKCMDVSLDRTRRLLFGLFPRPVFQDKGSYVESSTKQYDNMAFRYLSWLLFPLLAGYAVYSLLYQEHRGWYSWVLSMLYGFLLTFGFIMMTPQLFINYKLKSVAHLPWRMLSYKFLNTFIDDIFAFVIRTPTLYRLGCFRDDIVFVIYVYQRWIYRVDPNRINEFGISGAESEVPATEAVLQAPQREVQAVEEPKKDK